MSFLERVQAVEGLLATIARFASSDLQQGPSLRDLREAEFGAMWHELAQRAKPSDRSASVDHSFTARGEL